MHREGNKRSIFANVVDICKKMHRSPEHVIQFLFAELGTSGSVSGDGKLVLKGRYVQSGSPSPFPSFPPFRIRYKERTLTCRDRAN